MKRRFNYTGRKKIYREYISLFLNRDNEDIKSFSLELDLEKMNFKQDYKIYVEVYNKTDAKRFDFGTTGKKITPSDTSLSDIAYYRNIKFRILIVDETGKHGRIIAHADRIIPETDTEIIPILPVDFEDLGKQVWKISFSDIEGAPILILNKNIPNIETIPKTDPQFFMYIIPTIIREILFYIYFVEKIDSTQDPSIEWHKNWLNYAKNILPNENPPENNDDSSQFEIIVWIDKVIEEFCYNYNNKWDSFVSVLMEENDSDKSSEI